MLFNSTIFLVGFLPVALIGFLLLARAGRGGAAARWLLVCSLLYYAWGQWQHLPILIGSILVNFWFGRMLARTHSGRLLALGIGANLAILAWFKYRAFAVMNLNMLAGTELALPQVLLPLGISFYTFQQIAYLADARAGETRDDPLGRYALFVAFFPQLIAGPIVRYGEMMPQHERRRSLLPRGADVAAGVTAITIGLWKKVMIADTLADTVDPGFAAALGATTLRVHEAWVIAVGYALQMYFDFSGYSDMAIGIALLFGFRLPLNFDSPFKARGIIDYWSRWHMTLTRFLTAYIYNPVALAIARRRMQAGKPPIRPRRPSLGPFLQLLAVPTMLTMFLAGIWHGAGYQFAVFGLLHGSYLVVNHGWRMYGPARRVRERLGPPWIRAGLATALTFVAAVVALAFFRAETMGQAMTLLTWMVGGAPAASIAAAGSATAPLPVPDSQIVGVREIALVVVLLMVVWGLPNTQQWLRAGGYDGALEIAQRPAVSPFVRWSPSPAIGIAIGCAFAIAFLTMLSDAPAAFIYRQF